MDLVDFSNRFVYQGSWTTPPCTTLIYWNVLSTVYPISQKHLDQFKQQLDSGESGLSKTGNWRNLQKIDDQNVLYVHHKHSTFGEEDSANSELQYFSKANGIYMIGMLALASLY